jgi:hypothetical protein
MPYPASLKGRKMSERMKVLAEAIMACRNSELEDMAADLQEMLGGQERVSGSYQGVRLKGDVASESFCTLLRTWAEEYEAAAKKAA